MKHKIKPESEHDRMAPLVYTSAITGQRVQGLLDLALQVKANREQKPVDPPRPAQKGDAIKLDFVGSVDDKEFPGGAAQDYTLEIGSGSFIPGFEDQLIGAEVGKEVDVKVTFPAEYGSDELAGKPVAKVEDR